MGTGADQGSRVPPALEIRGLSKSFGASRALDAADVTVGAGEIHALVGQNGSGKSTMVKLLAGFHEPDAGSAWVHGKALRIGDPDSAAALNVRFVHQDLGLVDGLDSVENVALGPGYDTRLGRICWRRERDVVEAAIRMLGYDFDVRAPVGDLTPSERVGVAMARALRGWDHASGEGLLVLDEPTASMPAPEVDRLFEVIRNVRESGTSVLYVSHRFEEIFALADRVTVLRDSCVVTSRSIDDLDHEELVELLLGRRLTLEHYDPVAVSCVEPRFEAIDLCGEIIEGFDLAVAPGEVVGVAGVTGSGREELARLLFGMQQLRRGSLRVAGQVATALSPSKAVDLGIGLVPAERRLHGMVPGAVRENLLLVDLAPFWSGGRLRRAGEREEVGRWIDRLSLTPPEPEADIHALSGGNQQKVMVAKWLRIAPAVLVLEEPTQGVDVGSKADIHDLLRQSAADGMSLIVISTDVEELAHLCDRVVVMVAGRVAAEVHGDALTGERLAEEVLASTPRIGARS